MSIKSILPIVSINSEGSLLLLLFGLDDLSIGENGVFKSLTIIVLRVY
jgi:hypothetical protein